ncbi:MAG: NAD-dependent epimerase/dehydratase family protein [Vicinamibacterales bacterium]
MASTVVTGASGFIGEALTRHLRSAGERVLAIDRNPCPVPGVPSVELDVAARGALLPHVEEGATIYHLAASADVAASVRDPRHDLTHTFAAMFEVLETARHRRCRVIFPSTASVFDVGEPLPLAERAFPRPTSPYAAAKLSGEAYCYAYHRSYGVDVRVARLFSVYGAGMRRFAIHDLIRKIQRDPAELEVLGDGMQVRDYLYVDDAVRGLVTVASRGRAGEDYNVASGRPVRLLDLARMIAVEMGVPAIRIVPTGRTFPGDTPRWFADTTKTRALGFTPAVPLRDGLRRTIAWMRQAAPVGSA